MNGGDAKLANGRDQALRAADPEGNDGGAGRFEHGVIGIAPHPHLIIEAMDDAMAGPEPAQLHGARADIGPQQRIGLRERDVHRSAGRARGAMDARHGFGLARQDSCRTAD